MKVVAATNAVSNTEDTSFCCRQLISKLTVAESDQIAIWIENKLRKIARLTLTISSNSDAQKS